MKTKKVLSPIKKKYMELDAESIAYYRRNPCIACEDLLGIKLIDAQKYILQESWNKPNVLWCCSRNFGKSFLGAILIILKAILYENQAIYIVSSVGNQSKQTFTVMEQLILRMGKASNSVRSLKDIVEKETKKSATNKTGFSHAQTGYHVEFYNGSEIFTLNGTPDNNRSKRATLVFFDEAAFSSDELIAICEAFALQKSDFASSTDEDFNPDTETRKIPLQLVYASSMSEMGKKFYSYYKNFAMKMLSGNRDYFVCDMICDVAIETYMEGKCYTPLLTRDKVEDAMKADPDRALREYYNKPIRDGGKNQIIKWSTIRRNETFYLPELYNTSGSLYAIAFDPARVRDNSILLIMKICYSDAIGYYGELVNCINMIDVASKKKYKLDSNRQLDIIKETILNYNGKAADYENIKVILIDAGAGGGGISTYSDGLLLPFNDRQGVEHRGLIDLTYDLYEGYDRLYPNNADKLQIIEPRKYKRLMTEQAMEIMDANLIKFPMEYSGNGYITLKRNIGEDEEELYERQLSLDEEAALLNIEDLKKELTSIIRITNEDGSLVKYALPKDKESKMNDDKFYAFIMLSHFLFNLRRQGYTQQKTSSYEYHPLYN